MTTVRTICQDAMLELGILDLIDSMDAAKGEYALRVLNRMMSTWTTEELMVYTVNRTVFDLTAGKQEYTIGTGADIDISRPVRIQMLSVLISSSTSTPLEIPVDMLTDDEWRGVSIKQVSSNFPVKAWLTGNYPLNSLWLWPVPNDSTVQLVMYSWGKTEPYATLDETIAFPNGYEEAIVTNLAIHLAPGFGVVPSPILMQRASLSKAKITSLNIDPLYASVDVGLSGSNRSVGVQTFGRLVDRV